MILLQAKELALMKSLTNLAITHAKAQVMCPLLNRKSTTPENTEFIGELEKLQLSGQAREQKLEFRRGSEVGSELLLMVWSVK